VANVDTERGSREQLRFVDTEGADEARAEAPKHWLALADAVVIVFAVDDERSFGVAEALKRDVDKHRDKDKKELPVVVLANKADAGNGHRVVESVRVLNWAAREKVKLFEVSALDRESLHEPFVFVASRCSPPPAKSTFSQLAIGRKQGKSGEAP